MENSMNSGNRPAITKQEEFLSRLGAERLFWDGGTGSLLQARGLKAGELPETWNLTHPEDVVAVAEGYFRAGSDIVNTNTFGANALKYPGNEEHPEYLREIVEAGVDRVREANTKRNNKDERCGHGKDLDGKDEEGNIRPYHLGHFFIAIDTDHFLGEELCRRKSGEILRSVRASKRMPGAERIYTAGEKEYETRMARTDGVPINDSVQGELNAIRAELGLEDRYRFPWDD